jgi:uncharacterized membrane protein
MPSSASGRLLFLDGLRGLALVFMVFNHTGRWWIERPMGWPRYHLVYLTVPLAAPIFLFLVGFCLPLSYLNSTITRGERYAAVAWKYLRRGARLVLAGWLLTLLVFPNEPLFGGGVLQTIGLSIIGLTPVLPLLHLRAARRLFLVLAFGIYASFHLAYPALRGWLTGHPVVAEVWFSDFPLWPWFGFPLLGAVLGWAWTEVRRRGERLGVVFHSWWLYALANVALLVLLVGLGRIWPELKRRARRLLAPRAAAGASVA